MNSEEAGVQRKRWTNRLLTPKGIGCGGLIVLVAAGLFRLERWLVPFAVTDPSRYVECRAMLGRWLPNAALSHLPAVIPPDARNITMDVAIQRRSRGTQTLQLWCELPKAEIEELCAASAGRRVERTLVPFAGITNTPEVYLFYQGGPDIGTDITTGGFAVNRSEGTVMYWAHHHWAPFN